MVQNVDRRMDTDSEFGDKPKRIANLAAMATNVLRMKDNHSKNHVVRYIAQVDKDGWMIKRNKMGGRIDMFVVLEGTILSILRNRAGPPKFTLNIRTTKYRVDIERRELQLKLSSSDAGGKEKWFRLQVQNQDECYAWKHALESAVNSDITDYYEFRATLGSGAYGDVVEAIDVNTNEKRAVKIIKKGTNMKSREHLNCEIDVMKSISHPNIVQTYQIFNLKRTIYIVMEYVSGGDLFDFVAQHDNLSEAEGSQCMRSIFQAVEYLHRHSIVHRDLKPENVLCANQTWPLQIKVTDFGFARFMDPSRVTDSTMRTPVGTAYFMAPEIIANQGHGPAVDSWACGVMLYTILTGRLPFPGKNTTEYFNNVLRGHALFPSVLWKGISADAISLVKGLLNRNPNRRLSSLGALKHKWIDSPTEFDNLIRRDRSNLHSKRRKLFKARKAVIAVAMANKFKATIPQMVDKVGDGTKKVAENIGEGVKKTAVNVKKVGDGIGEGTKKVAENVGEGTKKMAGGIAGGTKKMAGGIGTGVKKTADGIGTGVKKTADGIGTGVKKTADGIGTGVKKTADGIGTGVKKTADGIETGFKKTADGIGTGVKKTAGGIESGFKKTTDGIEVGLKKTGEGFRKTSENIKRGVERVMLDRDRSTRYGTEGGQSGTAGGSDSTRGPGRRRVLFRRRGNVDSVSSAVSDADGPRQNDVPSSIGLTSEMNGGKNKDDVTLGLKKAVEKHLSGEGIEKLSGEKQSSTEYFSAQEQQSGEDWDSVSVHAEGLDVENGGGVSRNKEKWDQRKRGRKAKKMNDGSIRIEGGEFPDAQKGGFVGKISGGSDVTKQTSNGSSVGSTRPKLAPLDGLTMGLSDDCMTGGASSSRDMLFDGNEGFTSNQENSLRKTAALLLASTSDSKVVR